NELRLSLRDAFKQAHSPSWPGLTRPSTSSSDEKEPVDARIKSGHDGGVSAELRDDLAVLTLIEFVFDRLRVHVRDQGISHDLIGAAWERRRNDFEPVSPAQQREDDLTSLIRRVGALHTFLRNSQG